MLGVFLGQWLVLLAWNVNDWRTPEWKVGVGICIAISIVLIAICGCMARLIPTTGDGRRDTYMSSLKHTVSASYEHGRIVREHRPPRVPTAYRPAYQPPDSSSYVTYSDVTPVPHVQLVGKPTHLAPPSMSSELSYDEREHETREQTREIRDTVNEPVTSTMQEPVTPIALHPNSGSSAFGSPGVAGQVPPRMTSMQQLPVPRLSSFQQLPVGRAARPPAGSTTLPPPRHREHRDRSDAVAVERRRERMRDVGSASVGRMEMRGASMRKAPGKHGGRGTGEATPKKDFVVKSI